MCSQKSPDDNASLDHVIASYLQAIERGLQPDVEKILADHPDLGLELKKFLADLERVNIAKKEISPALEATIITEREIQPGTLIAGRYKLLQNIGEGGMGSVWLTEQKEPVRRKVAVKLIKAGMDTRQVLARFDAERQALAVMDHPNIAKVFDGGMSETGRPYFVMEYVKGVPITEYCDQARLSLAERLQLFIPVCHAVQHAHQKGIVHRDLKPSNILICLYDGKPVPKVIDFGLAKALHHRLTEQSCFTGHGIMVGTPLYMSPEQAEYNNLDVDTRTDVYSLGVLLYEILTGSTPLEREQLQTAAWHEVLRLIRDVEPDRPSTRLSGSNRLPTIAAQRNIEPRRLQRSVVGDLDWIVMKALEKERSRRYETVTGLSRDIERFLSEEPVEACPPSRLYRLKKFIRKNRAQVAGGGIIVAALCAGIISTSWALGRARRAEEEAIASAKRANDALATITMQREVANAATRMQAEQKEQMHQNTSAQIISSIGGIGMEFTRPEFGNLMLWSVMEKMEAGLGIRILKDGIANPKTAYNIASRAEPIIQAVVGLSPDRRQQTSQMLSERQRDFNAAPECRTVACWLAIELGSADLPALRESLEVLCRPETDIALLHKFLDCAVSRTHPAQCKVLDRQLPELLTSQLQLRNEKVMAGILSAAMARKPVLLTDEQVRLAVPGLLRASIPAREYLEEHERNYVRASLEGLLSLVPRMSAEEVAKFHEWLSETVRFKKHGMASDLELAVTLASIARESADQLPQSAADSIGLQLVEFLEGSPAYKDAEIAGDYLAILSGRIDPQMTLRGFKGVIRAMGQETSDSNSVTFSPLSDGHSGLASLAAVIPQSDVATAWDDHMTICRSEKDLSFYEKDSIRSSLAALARRIESTRVPSCWQEIADAESRPDGSSILSIPTPIFAALAGRLDAAEVESIAEKCISEIENSKDSKSGKHFVSQLLALRLRLSQPHLDRLEAALGKMLDEAETPEDVAAIAYIRFADRFSPSKRAEFVAGILSELDGPHLQDGGLFALSNVTADFSSEQTLTLVEHLCQNPVTYNGSEMYELTAVWIGQLGTRLEPGHRQRISMLVMQRLLDRQWFELAPDDFPFLELRGTGLGSADNENTATAFEIIARMMDDPQELVRFLPHLACTGKWQTILLKRLDELVNYQGAEVFVPNAWPKWNRMGNDSASVDGTDGQTTLSPVSGVFVPQRQFHTLEDAAQWISQNCPDFNPDAVPPIPKPVAR